MLADKTIAVRLKRSMYQPYAYDKAATALVEGDAGVTDAGRFNKRLLKGCAVLKETNAEFTALYKYVNDQTLPWLDDGVRLLPNSQYFHFAQELRNKKQAAMSAVDRLVKVWPQLVQDDLARLGKLGNPNDYPTSDELKDRYAVDLKFFPVPTSNDFRYAILEEDKAEMDKAVANVEANVTKYLISEMLDPVKKMVNKLSVPIGEEGAIFRDSLVDNVRDVVNRIPKLNINNDPVINDMVAEINSVINAYGRNVDTLRDSPIIRSQARDKMAEIERKMGAFMAWGG